MARREVQVNSDNSELLDNPDAPPEEKAPKEKPPRFDERIDLGSVEGCELALTTVLEGYRTNRISGQDAASLAKVVTAAVGIQALKQRRDTGPVVRTGFAHGVPGAAIGSPFGLPPRQIPVREPAAAPLISMAEEEELVTIPATDPLRPGMHRRGPS